MARRVVIVGGGVVGLCCAYYCASRGHDVHVVDSGPEHFPGCSYGNAGMIVPSHFIPLASPGMVALGLKWMWNPESPFYIKPRLNAELLHWSTRFWTSATAAHVERSAPLLRDLHLRSRTLFEQLHSERHLEFGLQQRGLLMLCRTQHMLDEEAAAAEKAQKLGIPAEVLDSRECRRRDPGITMDVAGSIYYPKDCHLTPERLLSELKRELRSRGVEFSWNNPIHTWRCHGSKIVAAASTQGAFEGDFFVLAAGAWSPAIGRDLGLRLPMQAGKGYSLTLTSPPQLPQICSILTEARIAVTPMGSSLRIGGTMEISGMDSTIDPRRVQGIIKAVPSYYPELTSEHFVGVKPWAGLRPCSPDGLPYLGIGRRFHNLAVAAGHAMMGLSLGPVTGEIVADLVSGERPRFDLSQLAPDR